MEGLKARKQIIVSLGVYFALVGNTPSVFAEGKPEKWLLDGLPVEAGSDIAVYSKYIWRGFKLDDDPVLQSGAYLSGYGFDLSIWGNFGIDSDGDIAHHSDEVDYSFGYTYALKRITQIPVSVSGGYTYYDFTSANTNSQEFYIGASFDILLSPGVTWYHDFEDEEEGGGDGEYIVGELSYSYPIPDRPASLDLSGHVGYNNELFILGDGGDIGLGAALTISLSKNCTLSPSVNYSIPFGDLEDSAQDDELYSGGTLTFSL